MFVSLTTECTFDQFKPNEHPVEAAHSPLSALLDDSHHCLGFMEPQFLSQMWVLPKFHFSLPSSYNNYNEWQHEKQFQMFILFFSQIYFLSNCLVYLTLIGRWYPAAKQWDQLPCLHGVCKPLRQKITSIILCKGVIQPAFNWWMTKFAIMW